MLCLYFYLKVPYPILEKGCTNIVLTVCFSASQPINLLPLLFPGKARRSSLKQKGSKRSVQRMKLLESYCDQLLKCDQTVIHSSEVTQFFMPKDHDLQPDFTKNRYSRLWRSSCQHSVGVLIEVLDDWIMTEHFSHTASSSCCRMICPMDQVEEAGVLPASMQAVSHTRSSPRLTAAWPLMRQKTPRIVHLKSPWMRNWMS